MTDRYEQHGRTTWPTVTAVDELNWKLRYARASLTDEDLLFAASVCSAYTHTRNIGALDTYLAACDMETDDNG